MIPLPDAFIAIGIRATQLSTLSKSIIFFSYCKRILLIFICIYFTYVSLCHIAYGSIFSGGSNSRDTVKVLSISRQKHCD